VQLFVTEAKPLTTAEIANTLGCFESVARQTVNWARKAGHVYTERSGRGMVVMRANAPVAKPARATRTPVSRSAQEPLHDTKLGRTLAMVREGKGRDAIAKALGITIGHVDANLYKLRKLGLIAGHGAKPERATPEPDGEEETDLEQSPSRPMPAPKVDRPPALPIDLDRRTIAVDAITVREDRFRCLPLACTLSAGSCVDRQETANRTPGKGGRGEVEARARYNSFPMCRACAIGIQVAARLREGQS